MSGTRTVLVVDDEAPIRQLARRALETAGFHVMEASNGLEGIAASSGQAPDLLLADLDMPELGGDGMVRIIRAAYPDLKVLYVTAHIDRLMDARPMLWEGEAYLDKPFTAVSLLEAVSLLLDGTVNPRTTSR